MKITCEKSELQKGVNIVSKAVPSTTTMPVLYCILITAKDDKIILLANDMELAIQTELEGTILSEGNVALNAKVFSDIVHKLEDSLVSIEVDENNLLTTITCEKSEFQIGGNDGDEFVDLPDYKEQIASPILISQFTLRELIRQTIFCVATTEMGNKIMMGELFDIKNNELRVIALDGHRVAIRKTALKGDTPDKKLVVPGKTLNEIIKILQSDINSSLDIYYTQNHIIFEFDKTVVVSRLIEGEFFHIDTMLSSDYETKISLNKKNLLKSVERAILLTNEADKKPLVLDIKDEVVEIKLKSAIGELYEELYVSKEGRDLTIGFNAKFVLDALRVIDDEEVTMYMSNSKAPCFIRDEEYNYIYLILPLNFATI
ncbi:MAG: DNA polymerase III subunit beta [Lachnospiraceae bacterium]|jgi:DNA polymerase-3 subunit beta|nr:DNA polymerase III subunit beta [Lachnospiraceae bacterium]